MTPGKRLKLGGDTQAAGRPRDPGNFIPTREHAVWPRRGGLGKPASVGPARGSLLAGILALAGSMGVLAAEGAREQITPVEFHLPFPPGTSYRVIYGPGDAPHHISPRNFHAIDFDMPLGSEVVAAAAGKVVRAVSRNQGPTGRSEDNNYVAIEHPGGVTSEYHHLLQDGVLVRVGEWVERGEAIGYSGVTGRAEGAHLHFVALRGDRSIPVRFVEAGTPKQGDECTSRNVPPVLEEKLRALADLRRAGEALERLELPRAIRMRVLAIAWEVIAGSPAPESPSLRRSALALRRLEAQLRTDLGLGAYLSRSSCLRPAANPGCFVGPPRRYSPLYRLRRASSPAGFSLGLEATEHLLRQTLGSLDEKERRL